MKTILRILAVSAIAISACACSKSIAEQMKMADNVKVECNPTILEAVGENIAAAVTVTYPQGYFHPEAIMVVTPVLVYEGGEQALEPYTYQGEKIKDNNKVVAKAGGSVSEKFSFKYAEGMQKSYLELRSVAYYRSKRIEIPAIKVADGVRLNAQLVNKCGAVTLKEDGYKAVINSTAEGRILYEVSSSVVRNNQLRGNSIKELKAALAEINANERYTITGTRVEAYASPEGGQEYNAKLSDNRAESAKKVGKKIGKEFKADNVNIKSFGQDWDGFQEAVQNSDIQDKDLILRVLSMYSDPAVREREIKNMSKVYTEINHKVFPELRRARFIADIEFKNFSDAELKDMAERAIDMLDEPALLRVAANSEDAARKAEILKVAVDKFASQKAIFNLAALALKNKDNKGAAEYAEKLTDAADAANIKGIVAMREGKIAEAEQLFKKSGNADANINLGAICIIKGDYAAAEAKLAGTGDKNEALAYLLNGKIDKAEAALKCKCGNADYIRAIIAARKGKAADVKSNIESAGKKCQKLQERAAKDIEFANFR